MATSIGIKQPHADVACASIAADHIVTAFALVTVRNLRYVAYLAEALFGKLHDYVIGRVHISPLQMTGGVYLETSRRIVTREIPDHPVEQRAYYTIQNGMGMPGLYPQNGVDRIGQGQFNGFLGNFLHVVMQDIDVDGFESISRLKSQGAIGQSIIYPAGGRAAAIAPGAARIVVI